MSEPTVRTDDPRDPYAALRVPDYRRFLIGNSLANMGRQATELATGWQIYRWTHSATALGLVGLCYFLPYIVLALPAGHLADRLNRRKIIQTTLLGSVLVTVWLAFVSARPDAVPAWGVLHRINGVVATIAGLVERGDSARTMHFDRPALAVVFLLLSFNAVVRTLGLPARASLVPLILPRDKLPNGITWSSSSFELTSMAGPALAGFIIAGMGYAAVYALDAALGLTMVTLLLGVRYREPERPEEPRTWRTLSAGAGFIWRHKEIFAASSLDMFATLLGGATALLPIFADQILAVGPIGLGWLRAAPSIGAVAMAMALAHRAPLKRPGATMLWAVAGYGVTMIAFGFSRWFWFSLVALLLSGGCDNVSVVVRQSLVQLLTPDHLRGRVTSVNQIFIMSSNEVGAFRAGTMAAALGPIVATVAGGVGTVIVVLATASSFPQLKRLGRLHELKPRV